MAVYLDSSALVKLVVVEAESDALRQFVRRYGEHVSSALAIVEVLRAVRMHGAQAIDRARKLLAHLELVRLDDVLLEAASALDVGVLRSLDAIHLASARALGDDLDCVVTYDQRMLEAARLIGVAVRSPGAPADRPAPHAHGR